jgi:hypothetical protein
MGTLLSLQQPEVVERIRAEYDRISSAYRAGDGRLALPACALLAYGIA